MEFSSQLLQLWLVLRDDFLQVLVLFIDWKWWVGLLELCDVRVDEADFLLVLLFLWQVCVLLDQEQVDFV